MTENVFEFYLKQITNLLNKKKFDTGLDLCREMKARLLANPPVDPVFLGWQRFYEFIHLVQLHKDEEALSLFNSNEEQPFSLDLNQITYMTSVAAELACNLNKIKQTLKLARLSWALSFRDQEVIARIQKAQNACIYFERLKENRLNFGFARFLTGFGKSNDIPVLYVQGLECLLANYRQSHSPIILAMLVDGLSTLSGYFENPPDHLEKKRIIELIDAINAEKKAIVCCGMYEKALKFLLDNKLAELLGLLEEFPDLVYECDEEGSTLLLEAVRNNDEDAVELLLGRNADVHVIEDIQDSTPLLLAVNLGHVNIARKLLNKGADPEIKGLFGQTPLIRSVIEGHYDVIALLLEYGVLTDRRDESGNTAIMHAVEDNKIEMVKSLIYAGADTSLKNAAGMSLLQIAESMGHETLIPVLKQFRVR
ncbi:MAG: ankyrin repeat and box protein 2 [Clostridiales bacterium]|jgi:ankyrin repeat protein|nr:ankyrin repeat and box protein 2 [Clostridiales bacterium]MDN5281288.1 ankyrin repeat and box protein 2 [Candidatus Ozemobacter sp.]